MASRSTSSRSTSASGSSSLARSTSTSGVRRQLFSQLSRAGSTSSASNSASRNGSRRTAAEAAAAHAVAASSIPSDNIHNDENNLSSSSARGNASRSRTPDGIVARDPDGNISLDVPSRSLPPMVISGTGMSGYGGGVDHQGDELATIAFHAGGMGGLNGAILGQRADPKVFWSQAQKEDAELDADVRKWMREYEREKDKVARTLQKGVEEVDIPAQGEMLDTLYRSLKHKALMTSQDMWMFQEESELLPLDGVHERNEGEAANSGGGAGPPYGSSP